MNSLISNYTFKREILHFDISMAYSVRKIELNSMINEMYQKSSLWNTYINYLKLTPYVAFRSRATNCHFIALLTLNQ